MEVEVNASLVLSKHVKLRSIGGDTISADLQVYESEEPYVLVLLLSTQHRDELRVDIFKDDLARELKGWLEGKYVRYPAMLVPVRIDEAIMKFVKFARPPKQEDLIMWILSRSEYYPRSATSEGPELVFGGRSAEELDNQLMEMQMGLRNQFSKTATIAAANSSHDDSHYKVTGSATAEEPQGESQLAVVASFKNRPQSASRIPVRSSEPMMDKDMPSSSQRAGSALVPKSATSSMQLTRSAHTAEDLGMFAMTKQLLGQSATLQALRTRSVKGRADASKTALQANSWSNDHWRVCQEIERTRRDIEQRMDDRRRVIEVARIRQQQKASRFREVREHIHEQQGGNVFLSSAMEELRTLKKIEADIEDDIRKQQNKVQRETQRLAWTMAPSGFANRRGKSQRGPVLGKGPLNPNATSSLKNPAMDVTMKKYYWDSAGRRHARRDDSSEENSLVEQAMTAIRKAAMNLSSYKLDLKAVFEQFDTSGDGFLSAEEMAEAFLAMGVRLDVPSMNAIFNHFDPNGSGSVHFGEFVWAFFNRRGLVRQWKRKTEGLTKGQIIDIFHRADINGNGTLSPKEFKKLLQKYFKIDLSDQDIQILTQRFDVDGDGDIDINEFLEFIESEQQNFSDTLQGMQAGKLGKSLDLPSQQLMRSKSPKVPLAQQNLERSPSPAPTVARQQLSSTANNRPVQSQLRDIPMQPTIKTDLNSTAPAVLQRPVTTFDVVSPTIAMTNVSDTSNNTFNHAPGGSQHTDLSQDVDILWMTRMLQAQADIEARLGRRYYKNQ